MTTRQDSRAAKIIRRSLIGLPALFGVLLALSNTTSATAPLFPTVGNQTVAENVAFLLDIGSTVGGIDNETDGTSPNYQIVPRASSIQSEDWQLFCVDADDGELRFKLTGGGGACGSFVPANGAAVEFVNFEYPLDGANPEDTTDNIYKVQVQATGTYGDIQVSLFTITVTDVNEAATSALTSPASLIANENLTDPFSLVFTWRTKTANKSLGRPRATRLFVRTVL